MDLMIPVSEAKGRIAEIVRESDHRDVVLLRHGRPSAVVLSHARFEALLDKLEDMDDRLSVYERDHMTIDFDKVAREVEQE